MTALRFYDYGKLTHEKRVIVFRRPSESQLRAKIQSFSISGDTDTPPTVSLPLPVPGNKNLSSRRIDRRRLENGEEIFVRDKFHCL